MKFSIPAQALQSVLAQTAPAVPTRTTLPILQNVLLEADETGLRISVTDLEFGLRVRVDAEVQQPGALAVPAKKLLELARLMPAGPVHIEAEGHSCKLAGGKASFRLLGLPAEEYPKLPDVSFDGGWTVSGAMLASMVERVAFCASTEESRPTLNGVLFEVQAGKLALIATDGHRLARWAQDLGQGGAADADIIVPTKVLQQARRLFADKAVVEVGVAKSHLALQSENVLAFARLIDGPYPNYHHVLPRDNDKRVVVDSAQLQTVLRRMAVVASDHTHRVTIAFGGPVAKLSVQTPDLGEGQDELELHYDGDPIEIGFNVTYLLDVLKAVPGDTVELTMKAAERPVLLRPLPAGDAEAADYVALVMPLRLNS